MWFKGTKETLTSWRTSGFQVVSRAAKEAKGPPGKHLCWSPRTSVSLLIENRKHVTSSKSKLRSQGSGSWWLFGYLYQLPFSGTAPKAAKEGYTIVPGTAGSATPGETQSSLLLMYLVSSFQMATGPLENHLCDSETSKTQGWCFMIHFSSSCIG